MRRPSSNLAPALCLALAGCWGAEGGPVVKPATPEDAANALTRALRFEGARSIDGELPEATLSDVVLFGAGAALELTPGEGDALAFDVSLPGAATTDALLLQVRLASEHLEVPVAADDALGLQQVYAELTLDEGVCARLCDQVYPLSLIQALRLSDGEISATVSRRVTLDCRIDGDADRCPVDDDGPPDMGAGTGGSGTGGSDGFAGVGAAGTGAAGTGGTSGVGGFAGGSAGSGVGGRSGGAGAGPAADGGMGSPLFACADGKQLPLELVCDGVKDCEDGSDEGACP